MWIYSNLSSPDFQLNEHSDFPMDANINIYWIAFYGIICGETLLEKKEFAKASEIFDRLITPDTVLTTEQYHSVIVERLFCELMTTNNPDIIASLYTEELKSYMSNIRDYTNLCRNFACTLLIEKNSSGAAQLKAEFFEVAKNAPCAHDVHSETELLLLAESKARQHTT